MSASGTVYSCFALSQMAAFPVMGWLAPRLGVTRLYTLGLLLTGLTTVLFGLLVYVERATPFLAACVTVRSAEGVGTAATLTAGRTLIINQFRPRVNAAMSVVETMVGAGQCLGPAIGGVMYTLGGYGAPFYTVGALLLATAAASVLVMPTVTDDTAEKADQDGGQSYGRMVCLVLSTPDNWLIFAALQVAAMNWTAMDPSMEPYMHRVLGINPAEMSLFFISSFGAYAISSPVWGRLSDAVDNTFLLVAGCLAPTALAVLLIRRHRCSAWSRPACCSAWAWSCERFSRLAATCHCWRCWCAVRRLEVWRAACGVKRWCRLCSVLCIRWVTCWVRWAAA